MAGTVWVNDIDLADLGLRVRDFADWWSGPRYARASSSAAGSIGSMPAERAQAEPRRLPLALALDADQDTRVGLLDEARRKLRGLLRVRYSDDPARMLLCTLEGDRTFAAVREYPFGSVGDLDIDAELVAWDPCKYDRYARVLALPAGERTDVEMGTAPCPGIVYVYGPATAPRLGYHPHGGEETAYMLLDDLDATDAYEITLSGPAMGIVRIDAGVRSNGNGDLTDGWWFGLLDEDAPALSLSVDGVLHYRRRWAS